MKRKAEKKRGKAHNQNPAADIVDFSDAIPPAAEIGEEEWHKRTEQRREEIYKYYQTHPPTGVKYLSEEEWTQWASLQAKWDRTCGAEYEQLTEKLTAILKTPWTPTQIVEPINAYYENAEKLYKELKATAGHKLCKNYGCMEPAKPNGKYCSEKCRVKAKSDRARKRRPPEYQAIANEVYYAQKLLKGRARPSTIEAIVQDIKKPK